jgi:beta-lactamase regulating signal transducer with metallopeptidase domain
MLVVWVAVAFVVVFVGSVVFGRWLQRKGRELERNREDDAAP